ncbi:hypothetical protein QUF64_04490 [Anaerolineales bacterium HSG6]|nr:hypothetical protein [Anaerolineales bacterium HSG6]
MTKANRIDERLERAANLMVQSIENDQARAKERDQWLQDFTVAVSSSLTTQPYLDDDFADDDEDEDNVRSGRAIPTNIRATQDIDRFLICLSVQVCDGVPVFESIAASDEVQTTGRKLRRQLKNATVGLEYLGELPPESVSANIGELVFATPIYDEESGEIIDFEPLESGGTQLRFAMADNSTGEQVDESIIRADPDKANEIFLRFEYGAVQDEQLLTVKFFNEENDESFKLRLVEPWQWGASGLASLPVTPSKRMALAPNEYRAELYIDGVLVQEGSFIVE